MARRPDVERNDLSSTSETKAGSPDETSTSLRRLLSGASWSLIGTSVARFAALGAALAVARQLGSGTYGELALVQATLATVALGAMGLGIAATKLMADDLAVDREAAGNHLATVLAFAVLTGVCLSAVAFSFAPFIARVVLGRAELGLTLRVGAPLLIISPLVESLLGALTGAHRFRALSGLNATRGLAGASGLIAGATIGSVRGALLGFCLAEAMTGLLAFRVLSRFLAAEGITLRLENARKAARQVARFSLPAFSGALVLQIALWLCQLILAHRPNGLQLVGIFSVANKWYLAALFIPTAAGAVLLPTLGSLHASARDREFKRLLKTFVRVNLVLTVPAAIGVAALAPTLVGLQGRSFSMSSNTLRLLAIAVIPTAMNTVLSQGAIAKGKIHIWVFSDLVLAVVLLGSSLVLVPRHGAEGLAVAYALAYTATCLAILPAFTTRNRRHRAPRRWSVPRATSPSPTVEARPLRPAVLVMCAFGAGAILAKVLGHHEIERWPGLFVGPACFMIVQICLPRSRPTPTALLSPLNFAWAFFALKLVLQPLLLFFYGPSLGSLRALPSDSAINKAMLISCIGWASFAIAVTAYGDSTRKLPRMRRLPEPSKAIGITFAFVGLAGVWLKFRSPAALVQYFTFRGGALVGGTADASFVDLLGTLFRPFGAFGFVILLGREWGKPRSLSSIARMAAYAIGAFAAVASFDYNRAAFVVPLVAAVASYSRFVRPLAARTIGLCAVLLLVGAVMFGNVRRIEIGTHGGNISREDALLTDPGPSIQENLQAYGAAPQYTAVVIDHVDHGGALRYGRSILSSAMSPVPVLGKPFRATSSTAEYNELVYGRTGLVDQVIPFEAELYWNFGAFGVVAGFFPLGIAIAALERRLHNSTTIVEGYILIYGSVWGAFLIVGQVLSVAQVGVYFSGPVALLALLRASRRRLPTAAPITAWPLDRERDALLAVTRT